ncbi:MAG: DUF971 domain-containing protein [Gammaproteobacteria bacterium]|nr:DUF971 domain-containing protein [Gammaproteobacteria bacterium]
MASRPLPTDIIYHQQRHELEVAFDDGARFHIPAELLRVYSPSAEVRGHWGQGAKLEVDKQDVAIRQMEPIGQYAVKIHFDDGHRSGLYDWGYLYDLGSRQAIYWTQYLDRLREKGHVRKEPAWKAPAS